MLGFPIQAPPSADMQIGCIAPGKSVPPLTTRGGDTAAWYHITYLLETAQWANNSVPVVIRND
jgi:hypothetical protein